MMELSNTIAQTLAVNDEVIFDRILFKSGCCSITKHGNGPVRINKVGPYRVEFHGNIEGTAATLAIVSDGAILPETTMVVTSPVDVSLNVSAATIVGKFCKCEGSTTIAVRNIGETEVVLDPNAVLIIEEVH